jgi:hypothetical protein
LYKGRTASCHRTGWDQVSLDAFDTFHNTEKKQQERQLMLQGKWPVDSCGYCKDIEVDGGFSDRMLHLNVPNKSPPELETDPSAVVISPTILEIFFNNTFFVVHTIKLYILKYDQIIFNFFFFEIDLPLIKDFKFHYIFLILQKCPCSLIDLYQIKK